MAEGQQVTVPAEGSPITWIGGALHVPNQPVVPYIEGDGIGPDIWRATVRVLDQAVARAYQGQRAVRWLSVDAGQKAFAQFGSRLPEQTLEALRKYRVALAGPLTAPSQGPSPDAELRSGLDLPTCLRPVRWFSGLPSPVVHPEKIDIAVFREHAEDALSGGEFEPGGEDNRHLLELLQAQFPRQFASIRFPESSTLGIRAISREAAEQLMRAALDYAVTRQRSSVTLVHNADVMPHTQGSFRTWCYQLAEREYADRVHTRSQWERSRSARGEHVADEEQAQALAAGRILVRDVRADLALRQVLTHPERFDIIAATHLNGEYLASVLTAQAGAIAIAPQGSFNHETGHALFQTTHDASPESADLDTANPGSLILCGEMLLRHLGWQEAADLILDAMGHIFEEKIYTADVAALIEGATAVKCSELADHLVQRI